MITRIIKSVAPKSLFAFSLFVLLAASAASAHAQTTGGARFRVSFEFTAGGVRLPAGEYTVRRASQGGLAYLVQSRDGRSAAAVTIQSNLRAKGNARPVQLTFNVYEGQYYLSEVWAAGDGNGVELSPSRAERYMAKKGSEAKRVSVIALTN